MSLSRLAFSSLDHAHCPHLPLPNTLPHIVPLLYYYSIACWWGRHCVCSSRSVTFWWHCGDAMPTCRFLCQRLVFCLKACAREQTGTGQERRRTDGRTDRQWTGMVHGMGHFGWDMGIGSSAMHFPAGFLLPCVPFSHPSSHKLPIHGIPPSSTSLPLLYFLPAYSATPAYFPSTTAFIIFHT